MFGVRIVVGQGGRDEAEKPFWISYADLMTALMMLFMVIMCVSLVSIIPPSEGPNPERERADAIASIFDLIEQETKKRGITNIAIDRDNYVISFGDQAHFENNKYDVAPELAAKLRLFVPVIIDNLENPKFHKWLKRVTVEGYTSTTGSYLHNLNLSLARGQKVLCSLLDSPQADEAPLTDAQKMNIRKMFMVGGYSANSAKETDQESRRVEFRLEFWTLLEEQEGKNQGKTPNLFEKMEVGNCQI